MRKCAPFTRLASTVELPESWNFNLYEADLRRQWAQKELYKWNSALPRSQNFVIDTPPPTVSGQLHMGHVLSYCHADFIARFQRMRGKNVFYPIGFDNNGLPTERLVEKSLSIRARDLSREEFGFKCRAISELEIPKFRNLFEQIGLSFDWSLAYETASEQVRAISQSSFIELFNKGQLYRAEQAVFWDPVDGTTIAQSEVEEKELDSMENTIVFSCQGESLQVVTTRPELLPGCVALLYNPADSRYEGLAGRLAYSPIFKVGVPIIADHDVVPEKGTGLVMCCTFGDMMDVTWWKRHKFPLRQVLNESGCMAHLNFEGVSADPSLARQCMDLLQGMFASKARVKIVQELRAAGLLTSQRPIKHAVKCAERSGAALEIRLSKQWFIRALEHKEALLQMSDQLNWHPKSGMKARLDSWIDNLSSDWCISRQRFFGVPIPVWYYKSDGRVILPRLDELPVNPILVSPKGSNAEEIEPDSDVMDTWATSALTPQINAGSIFACSRHSKVFPADLRPQGHEIIRTWAFATILKSYLHEGVLPWKDIMISGWCLAEDKQKMSKSKGNALSPEALLSQFGADVLRYWSSTAKPGANVTLSQDVLKEGKRLTTKLFNATKFCLQHIKPIILEAPSYQTCKAEIVCQTDLWMLSQLSCAIKDATREFDLYNYSAARAAAASCFWFDFCDRYIELVKRRLEDQNQEKKRSASLTLYFCIRDMLKLFAPFLPYISEFLFGCCGGNSVHAKGEWPEPVFEVSNFDRVQEALKVLEAVHKLKRGAIRAPIELCIKGELLPDDILHDLMGATCARKISCVENEPEGQWLHEGMAYIKYL